VDELTKNELLRGDLRDTLRGVNISRGSFRAAPQARNARDLVGLKESLVRLPPIRHILYGCRSNLIDLASVGSRRPEAEELLAHQQLRG